MPKQGQNNSILPFQGGLNTEANRFNYPPECTLDEQNFILTKDGKRERRLGIVLSDEDIDLAPEGILFQDKIRIVNDEGTDITEELIPVEETYTEQQNYNVTAKFTGYVDHTLTLSNQEKIRLRVYQNGVYAELYIIKPNGNTTLYKKYNKGDIITLPYILNKWESNLVSRPNMNFLLQGKDSTNTDIEAWFNSFTKKETGKTVSYTTDWLSLSKGAVLNRETHQRFDDRRGNETITTYAVTVGGSGHRINYSHLNLTSNPTEITYLIGYPVYNHKNKRIEYWDKYNKGSVWKALPIGNIANLTKDNFVLIGGNYGEVVASRNWV